MTARYVLKNGHGRTIEQGDSSVLDFQMVFMTDKVSPALKILDAVVPQGRTRPSTVIRTSGWGIEIGSLTRGAILNKLSTGQEPEVILSKRGARAEFSFRLSNNKRRTAIVTRQ